MIKSVFIIVIGMKIKTKKTVLKNTINDIITDKER